MTGNAQSSASKARRHRGRGGKLSAVAVQTPTCRSGARDRCLGVRLTKPPAPAEHPPRCVGGAGLRIILPAKLCVTGAARDRPIRIVAERPCADLAICMPTRVRRSGPCGLSRSAGPSLLIRNERDARRFSCGWPLLSSRMRSGLRPSARPRPCRPSRRPYARRDARFPCRVRNRRPSCRRHRPC